MSDGLSDAFKKTTVSPSQINGGLTWDMDDLIDEDTIDMELEDSFRQTFHWLKPACECGAVRTPNPNLHSRWCPAFEDPMGD